MSCYSRLIRIGRSHVQNPVIYRFMIFCPTNFVSKTKHVPRPFEATFTYSSSPVHVLKVKPLQESDAVQKQNTMPEQSRKRRGI